MDEQDRARKRAWKANERSAAKNAFPLPDELLEDLFAHVSEAVERDGCDHSLKATEAWLAGRQVDRPGLLAWLEENGGYCDCEVVANAADHWEQNVKDVMRMERLMGMGVTAVLLAMGAAQAAPSGNDPAFSAAMTWVDGLKRNDAAAVVESTSLPFTHKSTGLKTRCERAAKTRDDLIGWVQCLQRSNDLLLHELRAGDDVKIDPYRGPPIKGLAKLEKGLPDGEWTTGFLNGDGVTFTLRFLIVKGADGGLRVSAFLVKAFFEEG